MLHHKHLYFIKSSLKLACSRKQWQYLYFILQIHFLSSCLYLHLILWIPSARLLTRFDNELAMNLVLSINCNMEEMYFVISYPFLSILVTSFSLGTMKVMYFPVFSTKQIKLFFKFFWLLFCYKTNILVTSIMKSYMNFFRYTIF